MKKILFPILTLFFGLFLFYPICSLLGDAFVVETETGRHFSLQYFFLIFGNSFYSDCFVNSLIIAIGSTVACLFIALPLAYLFLRTEFPQKSFLSTALLLPLILPPFVGAIGLKQLLSRFGSVNLLLDKLGWVDLSHPPDWLGTGGFAGIIFLSVLHLYPIMYLSVQAALANLDPSLRDAARNLGGSGFYLFRTVTLPLAFPGVFAGSCLVFVSAFTDLGTPLIFNFQTTVPTQIFNLVNQGDNPVGYALVVLTLLIVSALFLISKQMDRGNYAMLARSSAQREVTPLGPLAGGATCLIIAGFILFSVLPHLGVILQSFSSRWFFTVLPETYSSDYYTEVFSLNLTLISVQNSLMYATGSALVDVGLGIGIAWLLARETFPGKELLDVLAMLPLALPGLVLAFAYYVAFSRPPFDHGALAMLDPRRNPTLLLMMAYSVHRLPYMVRAAYAGFQQTSGSLEEASSNLGAPPFRTLLKVSLPIIGANLIAGTILTFSFAMLDVSNGMILAQEDRFFPVTKAIYTLLGRITPTAPSVACALGVLAMLLLGASLFLASRLLGQKLGRLFRI